MTGLMWSEIEGTVGCSYRQPTTSMVRTGWAVHTPPTTGQPKLQKPRSH